jgi:tRNA A-37 threonylcarbamoyl transferase component Bud32
MAKKSNYKILQKIGQGGMSTVYLAHDITLDRKVAIKTLRVDHRLRSAEDQKRKMILRFLQEARAAAKLNHPNIVSIYHIGSMNGTYYIAMEYLDGQSFQDLMGSREQFSLESILSLLIQVCSGLEFAHTRGIIHRDIKPGNIILLKNGTVKITDFGIARIEKSELIKTRDGGFLGTIQYCSPEQLTNAAAVDGKSDLFSAGVVLYQFLTGKLPFHGSSLAETIYKIIHGSPVLPREMNPSIPAELERIILKALAKNPRHRFSSIGEFKRALQHSMSSGKAHGKGTLRRPARKSMREDWISPIPRFPMVVAGILLIGILSLGYLKIGMEKKIHRKDAAIRGSNMAKIFSLLMAEQSIAQDRRILTKYLNEVGDTPDIYFMEITKDNELIAKYHQKNPSREGEDVYMVSYPISVKGDKSGFLKVGFLKRKVDRGIGRVKALMGLGVISIVSFFLGLVGYTRFRPSPKAHNLKLKMGGLS